MFLVSIHPAFFWRILQQVKITNEPVLKLYFCPSVFGPNVENQPIPNGVNSQTTEMNSNEAIQE